MDNSALSIDNNNHTHSQQIYLLKNIDCANCASKIEAKIAKLPQVESASLNFLTRQLKVSAKDHTGLLSIMQKIADDIEPGTLIIAKEDSKEKTYLIENLACAHCAAKIEEKLNELPEIESAKLIFATKQLKIISNSTDDILVKINQVADGIEKGVRFLPKETSSATVKDTPKTKDFFQEKTIDLIEIILGAILFIIGEFTTLVPDQYTLYLYIVAYLILGFHVLKTAFNNLFRGNVFDENFLMSIATLGAFGIKEYPEAVGVMLFYRIGEYFEERATEKSRSQIMEAVDLRPETVNLIANDTITVIPAEDAKINDLLLVRAGDRVPVDGVVIEGESRLDTSPVTGEPVPVTIQANSTITSGCLNLSGTIKMRVEKPLADSMVSRILESVENAAANKPKIDRFITRFARIYTPIVVFVALFTAIVPSLLTGNWEHWIYTALTFLVISCPCALVLSVPLAFFSGIGVGSKQGILFKGGLSLEAIKNIKTVVMDKTGTLTHGNFSVNNIHTTDEYTAEQLLTICASCEKNSTHPIAVSIIKEATHRQLSLESCQQAEEIAGEGLICTLNKQQILCGNKRLMQRFHIVIPQDLPQSTGTDIYIALEQKFIGLISIGDTIKDDAKATIHKLKQLGLTTAMLTGDNEQSARLVATEIGIDKVHAKLLPQDKLSKLASLRQEHGNVFFIGDGINDAPILAGADVGAAMGSGADAAIEAADVVFMNSKVHSILQAIKISKDTIRIAWQNVIIALGIKILIMILGLMGFASMWAAVFADTGVAIICILNAIRILYKKY